MDDEMLIECTFLIKSVSSSASVRSISALGWRKNMNSRSPSDLRVTNANAVLACLSNLIPVLSTLFSLRMLANMWPNSSSPTLPRKPADPPNFDTQTATFAGAPPGAFLNPGASASETPETVGTKSIKSSPKHTTCGFFFLLLPSSEPTLLEFNNAIDYDRQRE